MINSKEYWEDRFGNGSWNEFDGDKQTAFFTRIALEYLPNWLIEDIDINNYKILDAGCAKGDGTNILKQRFVRSNVIGVDFSESAIDDARNRYPTCDFFCEDINEIKNKYDVVFSSNVLEHFKDPFSELDKLIDITDKYLLLLLPFQEKDLHKEHFVRFDYNCFYSKVKDFYQCYYKVINTSNIEDTLWPGKQILLVYVNKNYIEPTMIKLSRCHNGDFEEKEKIYDHLIESRNEVKQKEKFIQNYRTEILNLNNKNYELNQENENLKVELEKSYEQVKFEQDEKSILLENVKKIELYLGNEINDYNDVIIDAREKTLSLTNTNAFKLLHLFYRIKNQLIKGSFNDKKEFLKWIIKRNNKRVHINEHYYNPMFQIVDQLDKVQEIQNKSKVKNNLLNSDKSEEVSLSSEESKKRERVNQLLKSKYDKFDILFLSVIDYDFRYQRPQHLANSFSQEGHRVFYINANYNNEQTRKIKQVDNIEIFAVKSSKYSDVYMADYTKDSNSIIEELENIVIENAIRDCVIVVEYPTWVQAAKHLKNKYGFKIITDYLDDYTGFDDTSIECLVPCCYELLESSDKVIASSNYLAEAASKYNENVEIIRNGTEFAHFQKAYNEASNKIVERKKIGYYGAIAHWFDRDKIVYIAEKMPDVDIILIGQVTEGRELFNKYDNIKLLGEKSYNSLPKYLEEFNVCLIPFDTSTDLIKATNPVKFYEYLSAGKKIVATEIPELMPFKDKYVYLANDNELFLNYVKLCLEEKDTLMGAKECMQFAKENDWKERGKNFIKFSQKVFPKVSIILLTYNQLEYTKECLNSIIEKTAYPNYEIIIVDNKSQDDTQNYLRRIQDEYKHVKVILNEENYGFAKGNNIGIKECDGEYIILLNNDTVVTRGWLTGLTKHFERNQKLGILGPVTNSIGNEAKIIVPYIEISEMDSFAYDYTTNHMEETYDKIDVLAMFCLMISREAFYKIGYLEELYGIGMFEDDDYSYKAKSLGYEIKCAEDVFIHHYGNISFKKLEDKTYKEIFDKNKKIFEERWGIEWKQHKWRPGIKN